GEGAAGFNERAADVNCDGMVSLVDANLITKMFVGIPPSRQTVLPCVSSVVYKGGASAVIGAKNGCCSFGIDLTGFDFEERDRNAVAVDIDLPEGAEISACPMYNNREAASINENCTAVSTEYGYAFELPAENGRRLTGIMLEISGCSTSVAISEMYMCKNVESAEWICENRIAPATLDRQSLSVNLEGEKTAIRLVGMTDDDRNNTNGGMYHDFVNTKWPSIAVDENDNVYVVGSGNRMAHIDPFGNTLLTVSRDGGKTWGKPQNISNTVMDDRDAGILYLGNGEMLVSYFTSDATSYLSGGSNYSSLKPYSQGGSAPNWAAEWDSSYNPKGGIIGTYLDIISYINRTDSSYDMSAASYIIKSTDYGATWNTEYYDFLGVGYTANAAAMLDNYLITRPGTEVPVTSAHGPMLRSDGRIIFAGKVMNAVDRPMDSMAVYISDDGLEWSYLSEIPTPYGYYYNNFHELSVTENADGALVCAIRAQTCNDKQTAPAATIYTAFSYDGGITWTVPQPTGLDGTPPHVVTLENGDIIMTYSDRTDPRSIRAVVSTDGGRTWSEDAVISDNFFSGDDMGYPASAVLSDGTVVSVWYGTYKPGTANEQYSSILSKRWTYELD
ncbi:MAG: exo-alpha-sialidase, partial [Clostridia bacterium]|nr:exo-alpha-sialidase [Clostridia bacterium]